MQCISSQCAGVAGTSQHTSLCGFPTLFPSCSTSFSLFKLIYLLLFIQLSVWLPSSSLQFMLFRFPRPVCCLISLSRSLSLFLTDGDMQESSKINFDTNKHKRSGNVGMDNIKEALKAAVLAFLSLPVIPQTG